MTLIARLSNANHNRLVGIGTLRLRFRLILYFAQLQCITGLYVAALFYRQTVHRASGVPPDDHQRPVSITGRANRLMSVPITGRENRLRAIFRSPAARRCLPLPTGRCDAVGLRVSRSAVVGGVKAWLFYCGVTWGVRSVATLCERNQPFWAFLSHGDGLAGILADKRTVLRYISLCPGMFPALDAG
jgi:hypothetical protein